MKTKTIQLKAFFALLTWNSKENCVYVKWFEILHPGSSEQINEWPDKNLGTIREMERFIALETLLNNVRQFCDDKKLTLWSY